MASSYSFLATALLGAIISLITLAIMHFVLRETLDEAHRDREVHISLKKLNILNQAKRWKHLETVRYISLMKVLYMFAFVSYTSIMTLYLIDTFELSELQVGLYMMFTGTFLILHQAVSVHKITNLL